MLQRAASSARSWWWASHIRTKQSNWLDQNLQEMETRIQAMVKIIDEDGDSFAKRAEMYYKRRPELIHFVEEFFRAYKALADRYDHISGELHNARSTIATAFPDKLSFAEQAAAEGPSKGNKPDSVDDLLALSNKPPPPPPPSLEKKPTTSNTPEKMETNNVSNFEHTMDAATAKKEIDKLQKEILTLLMEKEFVKNSYEVGLAKYWEIEKQVLEFQATVCFLQEEYGLSNAEIESDEEQSITMAVTALNSCEQMLGNLQEEQMKAKAESNIECQRILIMEEKLKLLKDEFRKRHPEEQKLFDENTSDEHPTMKILEEELCILRKEKTEYQEICDKIVKRLEIDVNDSLSVPEYSHLIEELVTKVVDLETEVSTQNVQILRIKSDADHLQGNLERLQEDKILLLDDSKVMSERIKDLEEELYGILHLNLHIEKQKAELEAELTEACAKLEGLADKLKSRPDYPEVKDSVDTRSESPVELSREKNVDETSSGYQNGDDGETPVSVQSETGPSFGLSQEKNAAGTLSSSPNHKGDGDSDLVQSGCESSAEFLQEKDAEGTSSGIRIVNEDEISSETVNETPLDHDSHDERQRSVLAQPGSEIDLQSPGEQTAEETLDDHKNHTEAENASKDQPGCEFAPQLHEILSVESGEEKGVAFGWQDQKCVADITQTEESMNLQTGRNAETGKSISVFHEGEKQEANSEFHHEHEVNQGKKSETDPESTNQDDALESLSLELIDSETWQRFLEGMDEREKTLLSEYTSVLRNYRETKRKLFDLEKQNQDLVTERTENTRLMQMESARKDDEIQSLKHKLDILRADSENRDSTVVDGKISESKSFSRNDSTALLVFNESDHKNARDPEDQSPHNDNPTEPLPTEKEIKMLFSHNARPPSAMEDKFRREIDSLLEENLEFWLRFSASFHQIQKFQATVQEAQVELSKLKKEKTKEEEGSDGSTTTGSSAKDNNQNTKPDVESIHKHLTELQGELIIWLEQNAMLKEELKHRSSSLTDIQEELTQVSNVNSKDDEGKLTAYQAVKFQGEISNMQQENNKVADELQTDLDHVKGLQLELEKTMLKLKENFGLQESKRHHNHYHMGYVRNTLSRTRVPLRSILTFAGKTRKKPSPFSCMNPALQKQYSDMRAAGVYK